MLINLLLLKDFIKLLNIKHFFVYLLLKLKSLDNWGPQLEKIPRINNCLCEKHSERRYTPTYINILDLEFC